MIRKILLLAAALTAAGYALLSYRRKRITLSAREYYDPTHTEDTPISTGEVDNSRKDAPNSGEEVAVFPEGSIEKSENEGPV
jgi:hypothetical protein